MNVTSMNAEVIFYILVSLAGVVIIAIVEMIRKKQAGYGKP